MSNQQHNNKVIGIVKWFNNKSGFGFVTILSDSEHKDKDIFVHHTSIVSSIEIYKYLVQGEYVSMYIESVSDGKYENQGKEITGVLGGDLMCVTREKNKNSEGFTEVKKFRKKNNTK